MANAFFISEQYLKDNSPLTSNIDVKEIYPFINNAQDIYIQDRLGSKLYNRLKDGIINANLNNDEKTLLDLIRPTLAYYISYEAFPFLAIKIRNKGVIETADDKVTNADRADRRDLRQELRNKAEYYMKRVEQYMCQFGKLYPEYITPDWPIGPHNGQAYKADIALGYDHCMVWSKERKFGRDNSCGC